MIIENPDTFKSWLTSILEPLCDADPAALAKYVYALVKKDKPVEELREVMVDQLDVFLQQETKPFVEMLFKSLESQEYLKPGAVESQPSPPDEVTQPDKENEIEIHAPNGNVAEGRAGPPPVPLTVPAAPGPAPAAPGPAPAAPVAAAAPRHRVVVSRANQAKLAAPAPAPRPPPPQEHTLVKVLPLTELLEEPVDQLPRRRDRRGDSLREKEERRRRRSRSWERRQRARRPPRDADHPPPHDNTRRHDRPPSRSPSPRGRYRNRSPPAADRQASRSRSRSPTGVRERDHERERDRLRVPREIERDRMSRDREHRVSRSRDRERSRDRSRDRSRGSLSPAAGESRLDHNDAYKRRCRDYDEKGYCMRGDLCQWDHGADPVVLEDAALSRVLTIPPTVPEYNPLTPDIWCGTGGGFPGYPPPPHQPPHHLHPHQNPHPPRELIPIPRIRHDAAPHQPPGVGLPPLPVPRHPPPMKKNFDYNRLGLNAGPARPPHPGHAGHAGHGGHVGHPGHAGNCSLVVKKVPRGLNDITHLNNHFCKFGKIVNIQVCFEGDQEAALITFCNPTEANVAYKSTEAVLNNRFIKVFWHNPEQNKQENQAPPNHQSNKQPDRPNSQHPMSHNKVLINRDNIKATADIKNLQAEKEKELSNGQEPKKEAVKPAPEKSKQVMEMCKRAQTLLQTQLQQQVLLIQRLESGNVQGPEKAVLMEAINSAQDGIEKLRKELVAYNGTLKQIQDESVARSLSRLQLAQVNAKRPKTREEAQKEILDAELDMFTKQQEGQDVTELAKRIAELRRQMVVQYPSHPTMRRPHSRGGRFNTPTRFTRGGLAAKVYSVNQTVDHRPRALLISGFEPDELDPLLAHFSQFGEITSKEVELSVPQLVLQYKLRAHAEHAALNAKHYNDRTLSITWVSNSKPAAAADRAAPNNGDRANIENKEEPVAVTEDTLLRFEEEEEEEDEDRSWRR